MDSYMIVAGAIACLGLSAAGSAFGTGFAASAAVGASLMMLLGSFSSLLSVPQLLVGAAAAFLGCIFDSFLGSVVQAKYRCVKCGAMTEKEVHCSINAALVRGIRTVDNDIVNLFSNLFTMAVAVMAYFIFM
jgi:uncharacterized membrane protein